MNSYETEEISKITTKKSAFHFFQVHRQLFLAICHCLCHQKDLLTSPSQDFNFLLDRQQTERQQTDNRQWKTDGQTRLLSPAQHMHMHMWSNNYREPYKGKSHTDKDSMCWCCPHTTNIKVPKLSWSIMKLAVEPDRALSVFCLH